MRALARLIGLLMMLTASATATAQALKETADALEPRKLALVIGNADYTWLPSVESSRLDAERVSAELESIGFHVTHVRALTSKRAFEDGPLPQFRSSIRVGDIVVVYYSGHGFTFGGHNYLAPADLALRIDSPLKVDRMAVALSSVESFLSDAAPGILVLLVDACRAIPGFHIGPDTTRNQVDKGVAPLALGGYRAPLDQNVMVGYATRPGSIAIGFSVSTEMSVFTRSLLKYIGRPGEEVGSPGTELEFAL